MDVKALPQEISERIRSNNNINDICQCVLELVFNSLDAKATSIAIRINTATHQITIIDNGSGISLNDLQNVGIRYMTSRCESLHTYENKHKYYGYRGETLASIICVSQKLIITTKYYDDEFTYGKTFENGSYVSIVPAKPKSSKGTTVVITGFLITCPVRRRRINNSIDLNNIKSTLKSLAIIHPTISFSLRDDNSGKILLNCFKTKTVSKSLCAIYGDIVSENLIEVKVSKDNIHVSGLIYMKAYKNSKPQLIYVNRRPASVEKIAKYVNEILSKALNDILTIDSYPVFIININCPYSILDIAFDSHNIAVEFKSWQVVMKCIEKMVKSFINKYKKLNPQDQGLNGENLSLGSNSTHFHENENKSKDAFSLKEKDMNEQDVLKSKKLSIPDSNREKHTYIKGLRDLKAYKKTLGLKKAKFKLKKRIPDNIFERTTNLSRLSLSFDEFPSNMLLKKEKGETDGVNNIFDDVFDSQCLNLDREKALNSVLDIKIAASNKELTGKEFVMDLFLNSLTPLASLNNVLCKKELKEDHDMEQSPISLNSREITSEAITNKLGNSPEISFNNEVVKKRRIEKLNSVGTSLIKQKLTQLRRNKSEITPLPPTCYKTIQRSKTISTCTNDEQISSVRNSTENKSIQTRIVEENECDTISIGVQTSFRMNLDNDQNLNVENQHYVFSQKQIQKERMHKMKRKANETFVLKTDDCPLDLFQTCESSPMSKPTQPKLKALGKSKKSLTNTVAPTFNDMTFLSHYNPEFTGQRSKTHNNTIVYINTEDTIANLNKTLFKSNQNRESFLKDFENAPIDESIQPPVQNFPLNHIQVTNETEEFANTSRFFTINEDQVNIFTTNKEKTKLTRSVLIDTSTFLERNGEKLNLPSSSNYNDFYRGDKNFEKEFCNQTILSFNKFVPTSKSTQKEAKYCGTMYNFFESFMFNECPGTEKRNTCADITFNPICLEENANVNNESIRRLGAEQGCCTQRGTDLIAFEEQLFFLKRRADFIPKGLSPILKETKAVNVSLSPTSKKKLNNAIIESYENELDLIKWKDYIDKADPKRFFNTLYEEKLKKIEEIIPKVNDGHVMNVKKVYSPHRCYTFTKDIFKKLDILGQLDNKFIVALSNFTLVILLDQHAVHERIRVEALLEDYTIQSTDRIKFKSIEWNEMLTIQLSNTELQLLDTFKMHFNNMGLDFHIYKSCIGITKIPLCFARKCTNSEENLHKFISTLIEDELSVLSTTRGVPSNIPKIIQYAINNEACRGAVKFGQKLTRDESADYIMNLSKCQLPFQCAHGRPTLYPILEIASDDGDLKYSLKRLKTQLF